MRGGLRTIFWLVGVVIVALVLWLALRPSAVPVDSAVVDRGPLRVTVDEEGMTRVRDRYVISAPVAGLLAPCPLEEGDRVSAGAVVARLYPLPLDARGREQAEARLAVARAEKRAAEAAVGEAEVQLRDARRVRDRKTPLTESGALAAEELDRAETEVRTAESRLEVAGNRARAADFEVQASRAALMETGSGTGSPAAPVEVRSPATGRVLGVHEECERVVPAGQPIVDVGDPSRLEIVTDVLTTEAVGVRPGDRMLLVGWGGADTLEARVRRVEPSAFTKLSALGVEEQRVNVIGDLEESANALGDGYRVEVRIVVWQGERVLRVPSGALFRDGEGWSAFAIRESRARRSPVAVGHRTAETTEVLGGLEEGERVILYPGDRVRDGDRVRLEP